MDKKHTWLTAVGKKTYVRILAALLALCVLFTALPVLPATLSVFAAEEETKETENKDIPADDEKLLGGGLNDNADAEIEENAADAVVQAVLARIEALPDLETMLEDAPGEEEEGYEAWEARFLEAVSEVQDLKKAYDALTEEERAQIAEGIYAKLMAWWVYARMMEETDLYADPPAWGGTGYAPVRGWGNDSPNKNAVYALGNNLTLRAGEGDKTKVYYTGSDSPIDLANLGEISSNGVDYSFQGDGDAASGFDLTNSGVVVTWRGQYLGYRDEDTRGLVDAFIDKDVEIRIEGGTLLGLSGIYPSDNFPKSTVLYMTGGTWLGGEAMGFQVSANEAYVSGGCMKGPIKEWFGVYLSGSPVIGEKDGGLWMKNGKKFYLDGPLSSGAEIYINPQADFAGDSVVVAEGSGYTIQESDLAYLHLTGDYIENRELKLVNNQILLVTPTVPPHVHDGGMTFDKELPAAGGTLESGNYYLTEDVALTASIKIESGVTVNLCLNGHTLYGTGLQNTIDLQGGTLNVYDCQGGGVLSGDSENGKSYTAVGGTQSKPGIFNLYGGKVTGSARTVISGSTSTFNLFGGVVEGGTSYVIESVGDVTISGDTVVSGGNSSCAVFINKSAAVLTVKDHASVSSVGDGVGNYGKVNIEGGTITSTKTNGYGIRNSGSSAAVNITSGTVTGEQYGVYMGSGTASLNLSGSPKVSGKTADLYLQTGSNVTLENAKVDATGYTGGILTVTEYSPTGKAGSYAIKTGETNKDKFTLTNSGWHYSYKDGGLYLDNHIHSYTYTANGAVITERCTCGHEETATLSLKEGADLTYTGSALKPVTVTYSDGWVGIGTNKPDNSKIIYTNNTNAGTASAKLTISGKTASFDFTISVRSIGGAAVTLASGTLIYNGQEQTKGVSSVKVNGRTLTAGTDYTISGNTGTNAGEYIITVTGKGNYSGTKNDTFQIMQKTLTDDMVTVAPGPHYYTGNAITPAVTVLLSGVTLPDTDYTVSYADHVNLGTATVTVMGKESGNCAGMVSKTFTIECRLLPSGKNLTDYVTISPSPNDDGWYLSDISLTPKDGGSVGETPAGIGDSVVISEETGTDGETKTIYIKDSEGNIYQTQFLYKLDKTPPVIDLTDMSVENGVKGLWNGIIGKKSMIIRIPAEDITDALSGIEKVTYEATPDSGTGRSGTLNIKDGHYEIALNAEFSGTIRLTAKDRAGNTAQISLTADSGKVIAEDYAPVVTITAPNTPQPNANGWYRDAVTLTVTVTDDKDSGNNSITSGGIAGIKWKDGENGTEQTVTGLPGASPVYEREFTITADTDGTHTYYVQATDNAGNESGWQTVTVRLDTGSPTFSGNVSVTNRTQEGADITFTPSEGGKVYWIVSDTGTVPSAQEVVEKGTQGAQNGGAQDVTGSGAAGITVTGLTPGEKHTVYIVLEDAAGNLSAVKEVSLTTLQKAPEIALDDLTIDHGKETVKLPADIGNAEVYTNPNDPSGSKIQPGADGSLSVEPGTPVYIRYPEKTENGETTPASDAAKIDIPGRPAAPAPKQTAVTDTTVTVTNPAAGEEYILVERGSLPDGTEPDWNDADKVSKTGTFTGLEPNKEYELYVRKKATEDDFASESAKTEVRTAVTIEEPIVTGEGAEQPGNTALGPDAPVENGGTVTFTGTYGEEYTPVIKVGEKEIVPGEGTSGSKMVWDENSGKGEWEYSCEVPDDASNVQITVEFRRRTVTGIAAEPENLMIFADDAANRNAAEAGNMTPLTAYMKDHCSVQSAYDNGTKGTLQDAAAFTTADSFVQKGAVYHYTVSAGEKTCAAVLTVQPVNAAVRNPDALTKKRKNGGYTAQEVSAWLPAQVTVAYTGTGYTERTEPLAVTWDTSSLGEDFGKASGEKTVNGTVELPLWATGENAAGIVIRFENKKPSSGGGSNGSDDNTSENNGDTNGDGGSENGNGNNGEHGGSNASGENGGGSNAPEKGNASGKTAVAAPTDTLQPTTQTNPPGQSQPTTVRNDSGRTEDSNRENETASAQGQPETAGQQDGQTRQETAGADSGGQTAEAVGRAITASVNYGRIVLSGEPVATGNVEGMTAASTALDLGSGAVVVTVVCAEQTCTAGVADTAAVANAVLTSEQLEFVNHGETIEIRIDVTDISEQVPAQDKQVIESGMEAYREEMPGLVLGMYVDISMFIKVGTGEWNVISETSEPVEVVVGIPEQLQGDGREFTIIRAHNGEYTVMNDLDDAPDTITVSTELFSSYAIAYVEAGQSGDGAKCGLCHICPTLLGICCFIWLILIAAAVIVMIALLKRRSS